MIFPQIRILTVLLVCLTASVGCNRSNDAEVAKVKPTQKGAITAEPAVLKGNNGPETGTSPVGLSQETPEQKARNLQSRAQAGFSQLTKSDRPDEVWVDYRGNGGTTHFLRQDGVGREMEWETTAARQSSDEEPVIFMFAGAMGYLNDPKTEGFALFVNGEEVLRFDISTEAQEWKGEDKRVSLFYYPTWTGPTGPDSSGLFFLTLPKDRVTKGQRCRLAVRSLGEGTRRWFGVHPLANVTRDEIPSPPK